MADHVWALGLTVAFVGCASVDPPETDTPPGGPSILSVAPTSGPVGPAYPIEIVLTGHGFAEEGNLVRFGDVAVGEFPAEDGGTRIVFQAPKQRPSTGGAAPMVLLPGSYPITVTTSGVTSRPVDFELVRGQASGG